MTARSKLHRTILVALSVDGGHSLPNARGTWQPALITKRDKPERAHVFPPRQHECKNYLTLEAGAEISVSLVFLPRVSNAFSLPAGTSRWGRQALLTSGHHFSWVQTFKISGLLGASVENPFITGSDRGR